MVHGAVQRVRELADGFAFALPHDAAVMAAAGEWIVLERQCCPFLAFIVDVPSGSDSIELRITGPDPSKEILTEALRFVPDVPISRLSRHG
jgi:hypothetical protein